MGQFVNFQRSAVRARPVCFALACLAWIYAQSVVADPPVPERVGETPRTDYSIDLDVPLRSSDARPDPRYQLPDARQQERLESILRDLAVRPGDRFAMQDLEVLLEDVLQQAWKLMRYRRLDSADHLLRVVRHVNPSKSGLPEATAELRDKRAEKYQYIVHIDDQDILSGRRDTRSTPGRSLPDPGRQAQLNAVLEGLRKNPGSTRQMRRLNGLLEEVLSEANAAIDHGNPERAMLMVDVVRDINPEKGGLRTIERRLRQSRNISDWLASAERAAGRERFVSPESDNAHDYYRQILAIDPGNQAARAGLQRISQAMVRFANDAALNLDFQTAGEYLDWAERVSDDPHAVPAARERIERFRLAHAENVEKKIRDALARGDWEDAEFSLIDLETAGAQRPLITELRGQLPAARGGVN